MGTTMVISILCNMFYIMQWNARIYLIENGQEFKHMLDWLEEKTDIICIEETWLKPRLDFTTPGYKWGGGVCNFD